MDNQKQPTEKELKKLVEKVDKLVSKKSVKEALQNPPAASNSESEALMKAQLQQMMASMALMEKSGMVKSTGKKDVGDHKFWNTQPVPSIGNRKNTCIVSILYNWHVIDEEIVESGPIEADIPFDQIKKDPLPLPKEFEWCEINMEDEKEVKKTIRKGTIV